MFSINAKEAETNLQVQAQSRQVFKHFFLPTQTAKGQNHAKV